MESSILKKIIYTLLGLAPLTIWFVSDGNYFDIIQTGTHGLFFPFISGKNLLFRLIVDIAFLLWLFLLHSDKSYRLQKTWLAYSVYLFTLVLLIADFCGANKISSFFSGFERMEGFVGLIHYTLYFIVLTSVIKTKEEWKSLSKWFFATGTLVGLWGYFQLLGSQFFIFPRIIPKISPVFSAYFPMHQGSRIDSTLGNPAYFAMFCVYMIFIALYAITVSKKVENKVYASLFIFFNLILLYFTSTRSSALGLVAGIMLSGALFLFDGKKFKYEWGIIVALFLAFVVAILTKSTIILPLFYLILGIVMVSTTKSFILSKEKSKKIVAFLFMLVVASVTLLTVLRKNEAVLRTPFLNRFANISVNDPTGNSRIMVWKMSIEGFKEHPLLGWGQDNFPYVFAKHHNPGMYNQEPWFDRSHNVFFDWLIAGGILGLLTHLALYVMAAFLAFKAKGFSQTEKVLIYGMLVAQFINNLFIFDNLSSYILFYSLLAYVSSVYALDKKSESELSLEEQKDWLVPLGSIAIAVLCLYSVILPYYANKAAMRGMQEYRGDALAVMQTKRLAYESALSLGYVGEREIKEQFIGTAGAVLSFNEAGIDSQKASEIAEEKDKWVGFINETATKDLEMHPDDLRVLELYGNFYLDLGDFEKAGKILSDAHALAPRRQRTTLAYVQYFLLRGDMQHAFTLSKEAYGLAPEYDLTRKAYVSIALRIGAKEFNDAVTDIHNHTLKMVYPPSLRAELVGISDKKVTDLFIDTLSKEYPEKSADIAKEYKALLPFKK